MKIIIPARKGSKGLPFKNRKLFDCTVNTIPQELLSDVYVSTDDEVILEKAATKNIAIIKRKEHLAQDNTSTKDVMIDAIKSLSLDPLETVLMLYLTYPERSWDDVESAIKFFKKNKASSLLCKKDLQISPYLCMIEDGIKGKQVIKHDLYRRQDYPNCFEISHFICLFKVLELNNLNNNMYNNNTIFYKIRQVVDVDRPIDMENFYGKNYS